MKNFLQTSLGILAFLAFFAYGIALFVLGYIGIETYLGSGWAIGFLIAALMFRFTLPMAVGSVYGAMIVFGVNVWLALLIAVPTLLFIVPAIALGLITMATELFKQTKYKEPYIDATVVE